MRRRALLAAAGVGVGGLVGVSMHNPTTLRALNVENWTSRPQTVDVRVSADETDVLERTIQLDLNESRQVPCEWPTPAGTYRYGARLDGDEAWTESSIAKGGDACRSVHVEGDSIVLRAWGCSSSAYDMFDVTPCEIPWWVDEFRYG